MAATTTVVVVVVVVVVETANKEVAAHNVSTIMTNNTAVGQQ